MSAISKRLRAELGDDTYMVDAELVPLHTLMVGNVRPALLVLIGSAAFLLLIACANVVNLLLARAASRERELAVRLALGAGRGRMARQFLTETLVLSLLGGTFGVLLAFWSVYLLLIFEAGKLPRVSEIGVNWTVLLFTLGVSVAAAAAMGLAAAWRASGDDVRGVLAGGGRTQAGSTRSRRVRAALVVSQVGLTLVLLIGAGLLGRSFLRLLDQDPGFRTDGALVMSLALPTPGTGDYGRLASFHDELIDRVRALPGVEEVGGASSLPLGGGYSDGSFLLLNYPDEVTDFESYGQAANDPARVHHAQYRVASAGYFRALSIPLLRGRLFDDQDAPDAAHAALVSQSLAERVWPGEDALGKLIQFGNMDGDLRPFTVVGVVGDVRERGLEAEPQPTFYASYRQRPSRIGTFSIVISGPPQPTSLIPAARAILAEMNPEVPPSFRTLDDIYAASLADRRFNLLLLSTFGGAALLLALMGIYGVMSITVVQRTREIGVRMALGARHGEVVRLVVGQGLILGATGVVLGVIGSLAATRLMGTLLYGVTTTDLFTFVAVSTLLMAAALVASFLPARRAARVDPMIALRGE
jgi:putative ABC transport system permease protein